MAKVEWAIAHDKEAQAIQQAGQRFAERVLTDAQNDCYFSLVLLEWAERFPQLLPKDRTEIRLRALPDESREITIEWSE